MVWHEEFCGGHVAEVLLLLSASKHASVHILRCIGRSTVGGNERMADLVSNCETLFALTMAAIDLDTKSIPIGDKPTRLLHVHGLDGVNALKRAYELKIHGIGGDLGLFE